MSPEICGELLALLSSLCDGDLTEAQHMRLETLLSSDADHRQLYLEYLDMHARLLVHPGLGVPGKADKETRRQGDRETGKPRVPQGFRYALVIGATLAASLLLQVLWRHPAGPGGQSDSSPGAALVEAAAEYVATLT